jgi:type I restriction enzyme S subunit
VFTITTEKYEKNQAIKKIKHNQGSDNKCGHLKLNFGTDMKQKESQNHRLEGLKDFTEEKSVSSEQSKKIRDSDNKQGWEIKKLGEVLVKTEMVDPTKNPNMEFTYLDVSSVNKETKEIEGATVLLGKDAPSRARKLVKVNDVIFATVRPTHGRVALITEEYDGQVCSTDILFCAGKKI